jgi:hypothetical protein
MVKMVRVNTRISATLNDWLDEESKLTGVPKSTLVMLALENFFKEREVIRRMTDLGTVMDKLNEIELQLQANNVNIE